MAKDKKKHNPNRGEINKISIACPDTSGRRRREDPKIITKKMQHAMQMTYSTCLGEQETRRKRNFLTITRTL
jgi:hypothetical protein